MTETIDIKKLRRIIREEVSEVAASVKGLNHEEAVSVASSASKLLAALESFEEKAPEGAKSGLLNRCAELKPALEDMVSNPIAYVTKMNPDNVAKAEEGPKPIERPDAVRIRPQGKPVLDNHFVESINRRIRARNKK